MILALASASLAWELEDAAPVTEAHPVLVVTTPGFSRGAYAPLVGALVRRGLDPHVLSFDCRGQDTAALVDAVVHAASTLPPSWPRCRRGCGPAPCPWTCPP